MAPKPPESFFHNRFGIAISSFECELAHKKPGTFVAIPEEGVSFYVSFKMDEKGLVLMNGCGAFSAGCGFFRLS